MLWLITILILALLVTLGLIFIKEVLLGITSLCKLLSKFIINNTGFFTILFLIIFFLEQTILVILVYIFDVPVKAQLLISLFALIVVTTATFQKFIWEYKYQKVSREAYTITSKNKRYLSYLNKIIDDYERLLEKKR